MGNTPKIYKATLDKAFLESLPSEERIFFLTLAHILNEINGLYKLLYWTSDLSSESEPFAQGQLTCSLMILRTLVGKLKEAKEFLKGLSKMQHYKSKMSQEGQEALSKIKKYLGRKNFMDDIRNLFAFHYSREVDELSSVLPEELSIYLGKDDSPNDLYYFAEVSLARALYKLVDSSDIIAAIKKLQEDSMEVAKWFREFGHAFIVAFLNEHGKSIWKEETLEQVELPPLKSFSDIQISWFTDISKLVTLEQNK